MTDIDNLERDMNGIGSKLNDLDKGLAVIASKSDRTDRDVLEVWKAIDGIRCDIKDIKEKMSGIISKMSWIAGSISAGAVILSTLLEQFLRKP